MSANIISAGVQTTVQDFGRAGHRGNGVPLSGAADRLSLALANFCVGNPAPAAGLEITLSGPELEFSEPCVIALCGARTEFWINDKPAAMNMGHVIKAGDRVKIGRVTGGARSYLAIGGGVLGQAFLGSQSTYLYGGFGGIEGRAVKAGDTIGWGEASGKAQSLPSGFAPIYAGAVILRALPGPEFSRLGAESQAALFSQRFTAAAQTDRMGAQLSGPVLTLSDPSQMISSALLPGTVQIPQGGSPIVMLADGHCTGGYPRAAQVIRADHHRLGQIKAGTHVYFQKVTTDEALDILKRRTRIYRALTSEFFF